MDIVTEIAERLAGPGAKSAVEELLGRAGGEIARLRGEYEKQGVVNPWTGAWEKDGVVKAPEAHLDAAGRPVVEGATHATDARGRVVVVKEPAKVGAR